MIRAAKYACARISGTTLVGRVLDRLERRAREASHTLRVVTYHRIGDPRHEEHGDSKLYSATPEMFRTQMQLLADRYHVLSMGEVVEAVRSRGLLPPRAVLITFDDAYPDFQEIAWPILREMALPVTLFVPTAYPDNAAAEFWWDRLARAIRFADPGATIEGPRGRLSLDSMRRRQRAAMGLREYVKTLPHDTAMHWVDRLCAQLDLPPSSIATTLGWSALRQLRDEGVVLGAHTRTHPLLDRIDETRLEAEIFGAKQDLEEHVGSCLPIFAYPAGAVGREAPAMLRSAGFELAWTTRAGASDLARDDPLQLRRFHVGISTTAPLLRARLASA